MATEQIHLVISAQDKASGVLKKFGGGVLGIAAKIGTAVVAATGAIAALAISSGKFESVKGAFGDMTKGMGVDGKKLVKDVKKAAAGTLSEMTVMQNFLRAQTLIGKKAMGDSGKTFTRMAVLAKKAARASGESVEFMFDSIVKGVGRSSPFILDNLGLTINATKVYDAYAKQLGKTAKELTSGEKKQALLNAVLKQGESVYKNVAVSAGGIQSAWERVKIAFEEAKNEIGMALIPAVKPALNEIGKLLTTLKDAAPAAIKGLSDAFKRVSDALSPIVRDVGSKVWEAFREVISRIARDIGPVGEFFDRFLEIVTSIVTAIAPFVTVLGQVIALLSNSVWNIFKGIWEGISLTWQNVVMIFNEAVKPAFDELLKALGLSGTGALTFQDILNKTGEIARFIGNMIGVAFTIVVSAIMLIVTAIVKVVTWFITARENVIRFMDKAKAVATLGLALFFDNVAKSVRSLVDWIKTAIKKVEEFAQKVANSPIGKAMRGDFVGAGMALTSGKQFGGLAGGTTLVGEKGPELVNLPAGSQVRSAEQTKMEASSGAGLQLIIQGDVVVDDEARMDEWVRKIELALGNRITLQNRGV